MDSLPFSQLGPKSEAFGDTGATRFSLTHIPLLSHGYKDFPVSTVENLWLSIKVYASGGENALHQHMKEDHAFLVLQGRATFYFENDVSFIAEKYEGVMLPKGVWYRFQAFEEENLVLLRIGGAQRAAPGIGEITAMGFPMELKGSVFDADGTVKAGRTGTEKKAEAPPVFAPGKFFPAKT